MIIDRNLAKRDIRKCALDEKLKLVLEQFKNNLLFNSRAKRALFIAQTNFKIKYAFLK